MPRSPVVLTKFSSRVPPASSLFVGGHGVYHRKDFFTRHVLSLLRALRVLRGGHFVFGAIPDRIEWITG